MRPAATLATLALLLAACGPSSTGSGEGSDVETNAITGSCPAGLDESYNVSPQGLPGWSPVLSQVGALTLTHDAGHHHDDGLGGLGFCAAGAGAGERYLALVSARFETDQHDGAFPTEQHCATDFAAPDPTFQQYGMCFSGGNHHIYVEVRDENGKRVPAGFTVFAGGATYPVTDQGKPASEFPMNFALSGHGNQRYGAYATYAHPVHGQLRSDTVTNMRLVLNHHVNYLLTFQVKTKGGAPPPPPPPKGPSCAGLGDGLYCGNDGVGGDAGTLYRCKGGAISVQETCPDGCKVMPPGTPDACVEAAPPPPTGPSCDGLASGLYCGNDGVEGDASTLYRCKSGAISVEEVCAHGCTIMPPGTPDACASGNTPPPPSTCPCLPGVNNFCLYPVATPGCPMVAPGGYCDPDGNGDFTDADWVRGMNEHQLACP